MRSQTSGDKRGSLFMSRHCRRPHPCRASISRRDHVNGYSDSSCHQKGSSCKPGWVHICDETSFVPSPGLLHQPEAPKVVLGPACLVLDHALEGFGREGIAEMMKRHRHAPAIGVTVTLVA